MAFSYIVIGSGHQGVAAAYDVARFGDAERVTVADVDGDRARAVADRINSLLGKGNVHAMALDVRNGEAVQRALKGHTVALSAVPYFLNEALTHAALAARVNFCDLGGKTDIVRRQHALDPEARRAGIRIVPDCGMGPGMGNTLAVYGMSLLDTAEHVYLYDGGIPLEPKPPWNYVLTFTIEGLTNEYFGGITVLRDGQLVDLPCFTELEEIDFPPIGRLEAFIVAGGCSTAPWTFQGKLKTYQLKILRYPGTFAQMKAFSDLGLFDLKPVRVDGVDVIPRHVFHELFDPLVHDKDARDVCLFRARVLGTKGGRPAEAVVEVVDMYDEKTGFTAMQRTTGWHLAIVAGMIARGEVPVGSIPQEVAVPGDAFVREAKKRGFKISERVTATG